MQMNAWQPARAVAALVLVVVFLFPGNLVAQGHVVSPAELQKQVTAASQARQHNIETVQQFLSTPTAQKAIKSAQMDPQQVRTAVAALDDQELARLAARADRAQADFAAGALSERDLIWIILAIAALVLIIVAVR